jgi:hypothetical protein
MAGAYAKKTHKTLVRDVNILKSMNPVEVKAEGVRAKKEIIRAFLPSRI